MNSKLAASIFLTGGLVIGYKIAEKRVTQQYVDWHKKHRYSCWNANTDIQRPGDYPQVFVIEKVISREENR